MHTKAKPVDGLPIGRVANAYGQCVVDLRGARNGNFKSLPKGLGGGAFDG